VGANDTYTVNAFLEAEAHDWQQKIGIQLAEAEKGVEGRWQQYKQLATTGIASS
jgi:hypothetical protein